MNEQIEHCLYHAGLTAQGCWEDLDDYARRGIERFAELIIRECVDRIKRVGILEDIENETNMVVDAVKEHFGVK